MPSNVANPMGLEWHATATHKAYAMCRVLHKAVAPGYYSAWQKRQPEKNNWVVFGRVEPDRTGRLVASATSFDHVKYVDSMKEGRLHVEAIWALEQSSAGGT